MICRVTESMKYIILTGSISGVQGKSANLMEKMSTQKNINRPSDDPVGAGKVLNYSSTMSSIEQYQNNIKNAETWLSITDTALSSIRDIISEVQQIAISQSSAVASDETMDSSAEVLSGLIDSALTLMNTKQGDSYIFGGSRTDVAPFSSTPTITSIGATSAAGTFSGIATSGGIYTGTENKTYAVKIVDSGTLSSATYKISADGGITWGTEKTFPAQTVKGSVANTAGGSIITASTAWDKIDLVPAIPTVTNNDTIKITGKKHDGTAVGPSIYTTANAATGTVQDLLDQIETTFDGTVTATIDTAGKITVTDNINGESQMEITLTANKESGANLDFGTIAPTTAITLGEGIKMTFTNGTNLTANDTFTVNAAAATIDTVFAATANTFNGSVSSSGEYTGTENKTYALKIIGGTLINASYQISSDGGKTWDTKPNANLSGGVDLGAGIKMTFAAGTKDIAANDVFTVNAYIGGYYQGNDDQLTMQVGKNNNFVYNITGSSAFTVEGTEKVDLLETLNALKSALTAHDVDAVAEQINDLENVQTQVLQKQTEAGSKSSSLKLTSTSLTALNERITSMKSDIEDADLDKLIVSYQMEQIALEASYNLAAQIGKMTIMDYLR